MLKEKSYYETYRERVKEIAAKMEKAPKEVPQHILWLKSAAIERIENIDNLSEKDSVYTMRVHNREEITLSQVIEVKDEKYKYGFSEHYVNLLMHYAYEAGKESAKDSYMKSIEDMHKTLTDIASIIEDAGYAG
jgi:hypothetical protein